MPQTKFGIKMYTPAVSNVNSSVPGFLFSPHLVLRSRLKPHQTTRSSGRVAAKRRLDTTSRIGWVVMTQSAISTVLSCLYKYI